MKKKSFNIELMTEIAIFSALGFVLDFFQGVISKVLPFWINGGSFGIAMCAVLIISYRHGLWGLLCGLIVGLLDMMTGLWISPLADSWYKVFFQLFLDYFGAWTVVGVAGIFAGLIRRCNKTSMRLFFVGLASVIGGFTKFIMHFLSGMLFWPSDDTTSQFIYSLTYNGSYMLPSIILTTIVMIVILWRLPNLLYSKAGGYEDEEK